MSTSTEKLTKIRKSYLSSIKDPDVGSAVLLDMLSQIKIQTPELFKDFDPGTGKNALNSDTVSWSANYFSRHILLAEENFSHGRIEHLIEVREHLRKQGVKGFVPLPASPSRHTTESAHAMATNYIPSANLKKFVAEGDLLTIRTALRLEFNDNSLTGDDLRAALSWVKAKVPGLCDPYIEKAFSRGLETSNDLWTSQYFESQIVYLKANFSEERFLHLIEVRDLLRQQGVEGFVALPPKPRTSTSPTPPPVSAQPQSGRPQHRGASSSKPEHNPVFKTALMMGGAVAALAALLLALMNGRS